VEQGVSLAGEVGSGVLAMFSRMLDSFRTIKYAGICAGMAKSMADQFDVVRRCSALKRRSIVYPAVFPAAKTAALPLAGRLPPRNCCY
jgi:hypothetical protein